MKSSSNSVLPVIFAVGSASIVAAAAAFAAKRSNYRCELNREQALQSLKSLQVNLSSVVQKWKLQSSARSIQAAWRQVVNKQLRALDLSRALDLPPLHLPTSWRPNIVWTLLGDKNVPPIVTSTSLGVGTLLLQEKTSEVDENRPTNLEAEAESTVRKTEIETKLPDASKEEDVVVVMPNLMDSSFSIDEDDSSSESGSDSSTHASDHTMILKKDLLVKSPPQPEHQLPLIRSVLLILIAALLCAVMTQTAASAGNSNRPISLGLGSLRRQSIKKSEDETAQIAKGAKTIRQVILCDFH
mmetsp:Transcript_3154/g.6871  ORF Transcript_3154/g.6871 Transcript_3154/m.6871 type:complete len:299 (-) Transcript_3154:126-1022(-)|eukprot:CAMPEP_0178575286 /NCGR_PEP_ID=MMETSP0697-20121206/19818_1 /TAXON_ID=265572 /ORGANISM="Extubocellulus spinifer, Strain CCMP396" /LENGTH=298 /DNA_ID=CAMNT_0020210357 /DNA_START=40 /DNA_END=936 /DNA_ORIENTATION=-